MVLQITEFQDYHAETMRTLFSLYLYFNDSGN